MLSNGIVMSATKDGTIKAERITMGEVTDRVILSPERTTKRDDVFAKRVVALATQPGEFPGVVHRWEPDFSEGEPGRDSRTCGVCGRDDDMFHYRVAVPEPNVFDRLEKTTKALQIACFLKELYERKLKELDPSFFDSLRSSEKVEVQRHVHVAKRDADGTLLRECGRCGHDISSGIHVRVREWTSVAEPIDSPMDAAPERKGGEHA